MHKFLPCATQNASGFLPRHHLMTEEQTQRNQTGQPCLVEQSPSISNRRNGKSVKTTSLSLLITKVGAMVQTQVHKRTTDYSQLCKRITKKKKEITLPLPLLVISDLSALLTSAKILLSEKIFQGPGSWPKWQSMCLVSSMCLSSKPLACTTRLSITRHDLPPNPKPWFQHFQIKSL